jgi:energy-coupling factor transporter ATP-binding protein EcfA2
VAERAQAAAEESMLKRLKLHRFRYIEPGTELRFTERFNVLLGRNGTGKTTLLDLISMVLRSDFSTLKDEEFDIEYEWVDEDLTGLFRFENRPKTPPSGLQASTTLRGAGRPRQYQPRATVRMKWSSTGMEQEAEIDGAVMRSRENGGTWIDEGIVDVFADSFLGKFLFGAEFAYRFDESLETFDSITAGDAGKTPKPGRAPFVRLERRLIGNLAESTFVPSQYLPTSPEPGQSSAKVALPPGSSFAKLPQIANVKDMSMSFAIDGVQQRPDGLWLHFGRAEFLFSGARGVVFNQDALSYGQKRLLAFLWYLDANPDYVVADELVNGMHHDWIRASLDEIGQRQAFLTSQNPLLLDYLPLESVEQIQKTFIQCRTELVDDEPHISWSNLSAEDAAELFADYQVGIQPVGEILRARGLW